MRLLASLTALIVMGVGAGHTKENPTQERAKSSHELWQQYAAIQQNFTRVKKKLPDKLVGCKGLGKAIVYYRRTVWEQQDKLGESRTKYRRVEKLKNACAYKRWHVKKLRTKAYHYQALVRKVNYDPRTAICYVFGSYCSQAIAVASCESHLHTTAQNGQYLGMFQMGSSERSTYGHGSTALEQARAANRYFIASGRDWSPWSCKPW